MNRKNALLIKLLLIAIMVLQPVGAAFSITVMSHHSNGASDMSQYTALMDHHDQQSNISEHAAHVDHAYLNAEMDGCSASTAACSMASCIAVFYMSTISIPQFETVAIHPSIDHSWVGILLPTEIKPPRNLVG